MTGVEWHGCSPAKDVKNSSSEKNEIQIEGSFVNIPVPYEAKRAAWHFKPPKTGHRQYFLYAREIGRIGRRFARETSLFYFLRQPPRLFPQLCSAGVLGN
jgi:hypothetical protein